MAPPQAQSRWSRLWRTRCGVVWEPIHEPLDGPAVCLHARRWPWAAKFGQSHPLGGRPSNARALPAARRRRCAAGPQVAAAQLQALCRQAQVRLRPGAEGGHAARLLGLRNRLRLLLLLHFERAGAASLGSRCCRRCCSRRRWCCHVGHRYSGQRARRAPQQPTPFWQLLGRSGSAAGSSALASPPTLSHVAACM